jgi:glycosyltransferase involved in cell wall biosynthesis
MRFPLVTIVIPCHRQAHFLRDAVASALDQTHPAVEVVVVDDAAPDGWLAEAVAHEFGVSFVRTAETLGPGGARNAGIAAGTGEYVLPLDADDILAPDYAARAVTVLQSTPEAGVVYCKLQTFGAGSWTWEPPPGWTLRQLMHANQLPNEALYRRTCWERAGGYAARVFFGEDWDFWVRVARQGWQLVRIPEYLLFCRQHETNLSRRMYTEYARCGRRILTSHACAATDVVVSFDAAPVGASQAACSR